MATNNQLLNCPPLRFPDFSDPWQQTTLGKIGEIRMCKRILANQTNNEGGIPFFKIGTIGKKEDSYISETLFQEYKSKYHYLNKGQILITCAGTIGRCLIFDGNDAYYQDSNIVWIDNDESSITNPYLYYLLYSTDWSKLNTSTIVRLYNDDLRALPMSFPSSLKEQEKITEFLSLIDERIEAQRQTIEERKKQKKALLHQIFSQSLRFPEFSEPWTQTTLGEVAERVIRKNHNNESNRPLTISAQYGLIDQRDFFKKVIASNNLEGYYLLHQGEFAYNRSSSADYPWGAIKRLDKYSQGVLSTLYICFRITKGNPLFFTYLFDAFKWHSYVQSISAEGARNHGLLNIVVSDFFDMPISLPSLEEQRKIAELFTIFDERVEVEEALLECYEAQKRYLLRQMFV